jgi:hypothetical protein
MAAVEVTAGGGADDRGVNPKFEVLWVIYYGSFDDTT